MRGSPAWRTLWLTIAFAAVLATPMHYRAEVHPANESARVYAALAIVQHGTVALDPVFDRFFPRWRNADHPPNVDVSRGEGRYVLDKAPGVTLLAVPVVALVQALGVDPATPATFPWIIWLLTLLVVALPCALATVHLDVALRREGAPSLAGVALLATPWLAYGGLLFGHGLAAALLVSGALFALGSPGGGPSSPRITALGGLLLGFAVLTEYPAAVLVVMVFIAMLADPDRRARVPWLVLGGLGPALALGAWNAACFGSPLTLSYAHKSDPALVAVHAQGAWGVTAPSPTRLFELLVGSSRGLLFLAPWLAAGLVGALMAVRERGLAMAWRVALPLLCLGYPILISGFGDWTAGASMGPRHLVPVIPVLALAAALALRSRPRLTAAVGALAVSSFALCVVGAWVYPYFPTAVRNPLFEVALPILLDTGLPPAALDALLPSPIGLLVGLAIAAAVLAPSGWRAVRALPRTTVTVAVAAALAVAHVALAMLPATSGPDADRRVLHERAAALDVLGHDAQAQAIRKALRPGAHR